jgi:hypothetical protein
VSASFSAKLSRLSLRSRIRNDAGLGPALEGRTPSDAISPGCARERVQRDMMCLLLDFLVSSGKLNVRRLEVFSDSRLPQSRGRGGILFMSLKLELEGV